MSDSLRKINSTKIIFFATFVIASAVYLKFLSFGHISWDDPEMVFKNKSVKNFNINELISGHFVGNYIPLTMLVHGMGWLLFGNHDAGHHLLNILFHLLNGLLVFYAGKRLIKNEHVALTGMVIFLLHPVQMESVGWISELKNILSTTFYFAGLIQYLIYADLHDKKHYWLTMMFFLLGCLSKSSVVIFPLSLVCIDIYVQKKISYKFFLDKIPMLAISFLFGIINLQTQAADLFINYSHAFPYAQRAGFAGLALLKYLFMFLAPVHLSVIYPYPLNNNGAMFTGFFAILCLLFVLGYFYWKKKYGFLSLVLFTLVNFLLVLQFVPFGEVLYADRYMYIPLAGFAWIFASLLFKIRIPVVPSILALITSLALLSFSRANVWRSGIFLYQDILKSFPNSFVALNSVGVEYMLRDDDEKAIYFINKSIGVAPYNYKGFYNRGLFYLKNLKAAEAVKSFNQSLEIYDYSKAYVGRASAYHMLGDLKNAIKDANKALAIEKNNAKAHYVLGNCYNDQNQLDDALHEYNTCISLNNEEPDFYFKRGIVYGKKQEFALCIADLEISLAMDPGRYEANYWIGVAKVNLKQNPCRDLRIAAENNYEPAISAYNKYCK